jgi:hypothetical protein
MTTTKNTNYYISTTSRDWAAEDDEDFDLEAFRAKNDSTPIPTLEELGPLQYYEDEDSDTQFELVNPRRFQEIEFATSVRAPPSIPTPYKKPSPTETNFEVETDSEIDTEFDINDWLDLSPEPSQFTTPQQIEDALLSPDRSRWPWDAPLACKHKSAFTNNVDPPAYPEVSLQADRRVKYANRWFMMKAFMRLTGPRAVPMHYRRSALNMMHTPESLVAEEEKAGTNDEGEWWNDDDSDEVDKFDPLAREFLTKRIKHDVGAFLDEENCGLYDESNNLPRSCQD